MITEQGNRELDRVTSDGLRHAGTVTVLLHRIKNMSWPRRRRAVVHNSEDINHGVSRFGAVPEQSVKDLGLSHHGE
jgi:hypothetical protein